MYIKKNLFRPFVQNACNNKRVKHVVRNMNVSKGKKMIKMEINAGLRFGNIYMSGLCRSSRPSQFRCKQVFFVLHKLLDFQL